MNGPLISREAFLRHFYPLALLEDCSTRNPAKNAAAYKANVARKDILLDATSTWFIAFAYALYAMQRIEACQCVSPEIVNTLLLASIGISVAIFSVFMVVYTAAYLYLSFVQP